MEPRATASHSTSCSDRSAPSSAHSSAQTSLPTLCDASMSVPLPLSHHAQLPIPSSVKGAPPHLRRAIRRRQNSESAKRSRLRRKQAAVMFQERFDEQCQRIRTLENRIYSLHHMLRTRQQRRNNAAVPHSSPQLLPPPVEHHPRVLDIQPVHNQQPQHRQPQHLQHQHPQHQHPHHQQPQHQQPQHQQPQHQQPQYQHLQRQQYPLLPHNLLQLLPDHPQSAPPDFDHRKTHSSSRALTSSSPSPSVASDAPLHPQLPSSISLSFGMDDVFDALASSVRSQSL